MEIKGSQRIDWHYPNIYAWSAPLDKLTIGMIHTRASNEFALEFDSVRDGWVVRMDRTKWADDIAETIEEGVEVAFIPAWLESSAPSTAAPTPPASEKEKT